MRICKKMKKIDECKDIRLPKKRAGRKASVYSCSSCKYESNRLFNVVRHEERIHWKKRLRVCCGEKFFTKGNYYIHCEQKHPESRPHAITSRMKYKITSDTMAIAEHNTKSLVGQRRTSHLHLQQRCSERIRNQKQRAVKSELSLKFVTCSDIDIEDIPLINFLTDHRHKTHVKKLSSSKSTSKSSDRHNEKVNQTVKIAISAQQNIENVTSKNGVETVRTTVSHSSISSFSLVLPTKKLLLQRFRTNLKHEFGLHLREQNNNIREQVNFADQSREENTPPTRQSWPKYSKWTSRANRENVPKFAFSLEQQLDIRLDTGINVPMVSQVHRDFLAPIDFEKYKIF